MRAINTLHRHGVDCPRFFAARRASLDHPQNQLRLGKSYQRDEFIDAERLSLSLIMEKDNSIG
ncbi:hypothetical protein [Amycolatopsis thermoflava]|uniref:hypothetical protein n=1 Tax=Amycolatopsis thermoflava TaxID=84480 RepID=UPI00381EC25C